MEGKSNITMNYTFPPAIQFGAGVTAKLGEYLKRKDAKKVLIVTEQGIVTNVPFDL